MRRIAYPQCQYIWTQRECGQAEHIEGMKWMARQCDLRATTLLGLNGVCVVRLCDLHARQMQDLIFVESEPPLETLP